MKITHLEAESLRCFRTLEFRPEPGVNWLIGANGVGKTTILEAAHILSHGRSFRVGGRSAPCRSGEHRYLIRARLERGRRADIRIALERTEEHWYARQDGSDVHSLAPLFEACPVVYFGPESAALIVGSAEGRRNLLDWSVFHVEHTSLELWRVWRRALRQRNALLRNGAPDTAFAPWEHGLGKVAERIHSIRDACLTSLEPYFQEELAALAPELGAAALSYHPGWDTQLGLAQQLETQRPLDRQRGFTRCGVHHADWSLRFEQLARKEHLSRGQAKVIALACVLAQARWLRDRTGDDPLLCLDDIGSELDAQHAARAFRWLQGKTFQVWMTATRPPGELQPPIEVAVFHVEQTGPIRT